MQIEIKDFGPIKQFTYDLEKDLIITYGNNNIGKSYSMQIVYLLLKSFLGIMYSFRPFYKNQLQVSFIPFNSLREELEKVVRQFLDSDLSSRDITAELVQGTCKNLENVLLHDFMNSCDNTFGNLDKTLEQEPVITVKHSTFEFIIKLKPQKVEGSIDIKPVRLVKTESGSLKSRNYNKHLDIYVLSDILQPAVIMYEQIQKNLLWCIQSVRTLFENVYFLPASRSGIYSGMNAFGSIVAELSKNRAYFTKKIEFPGISEPISDYFIFLSNIKPRNNEKLSQYYTQIEDNILKGKVTFNKAKNALMYKPQNLDADFEMTEVSSMVSEISPIVAFLKYILTVQSERGRRGKAVLFIEEPEAHLHPQNQIALIEIFSNLIKANVKLIMSSHSNYIFNKLNNLVLGGNLDYRLYQPIVLTDGAEGIVSKVLPINELGADDENFVDVSERLYCEREEIIQKLNMGE